MLSLKRAANRAIAANRLRTCLHTMTKSGRRAKFPPSLLTSIGSEVQVSSQMPASIQLSRAFAAGADGAKKKKDPTLGGVAICDGNEAAAYVSYALSDATFIYPITPSSTMGELADEWTAQGRKNSFDQAVRVVEMQSEAGAAGAVHGSCAAGALTCTYTASQGLLLMIPNMYKIAGERLPCVFHVAARALAGHALSIFGDHSDVMSIRQTGWALLSSHSVQECHDLAVIAHVATLESSIPFVHFFDGFRLSHEIAKINRLSYADIGAMVPTDKINTFRSRALNPNHPHMRGTSQGPDIFFQMLELTNPDYAALPDVVDKVMKDFEKRTGRAYKLFDYYGAKDAENVVVMMGGGSQTVEEVIANHPDEKIGVLKCRLYRPWSAKHFFEQLPVSTKKIAVLDRTKEAGSMGEPLFLDVIACLQQNANFRNIEVIGGRYGLGSKDFTPAMARAVFDNLKQATPQRNFTVGINDDVSHLSLAVDEGYALKKTPGTVECMFYGLGADGTVGANKDAIKIIGDNTDLSVQAYFAYDAKKSGGVTVSHLRFGPNIIKSNYLVNQADYIGCHNAGYIFKYDMLKGMKPGGTFLLNSPWTTAEDMDKFLPGSVKRAIAAKKINFYNIDAHSLAVKLGLGKHINMLCQASFFKLSEVLPFEQSVALLKESIVKTYSKKGEAVVKKNQNAVDNAIGGLTQIHYDAAKWAVAPLEAKPPASSDPYVSQVMEPVLAMEGDSLPVSTFQIQEAGRVPLGTAAFEKRGIAAEVPSWNSSKCTQCNICSTVCPHAAIRPFLFSDDELKAAPHPLDTLKAKGSADMSAYRYRVQVSPLDCTGCEVCVLSCPDDALSFKPLSEVKEEIDNFQFATAQPNKAFLVKDSSTFKDVQFQQPLLEFSGACAGCGETPYVKLLTQLFGSRLMIANATGCSSIWAGSAPANPYTTNQDGKGPAWGNSLFEDAAEYGFGMVHGTLQRREGLLNNVKKLLENPSVPLSKELRTSLTKWSETWSSPECCELVPEIERLLKVEVDKHPLVKQILDSSDILTKPSQWVIGGDGWAYDIGYGGLDHVLASGENINILVLDTEMYSNTGGQASKSTPLGSLAKFASTGKQRAKKDLGQIAMAYEDVYVSSISLAANMQQAVNAFKAAESYPGVSIILAYAPCISHGLSGGMSQMANTMKMAVETGYWELFTRDPRNAEKGENPFVLESRKIKDDVAKFYKKQNRFQQLHMKDHDMAQSLNDRHALSLKKRHELYTRKSMNDEALFEQLTEMYGESNHKDKYYILYGSETGNAEGLAKYLFTEAKRRDLNVQVLAMEEADVEKMKKAKGVVYVCSTAGRGEFPENAKLWWSNLNDESAAPAETFKGVNYAVFGLGDSAYCHYQAAARHLNKRMKELGATEILPMGEGNDQDEDRYETAWDDWMPDLFTELGAEAKNKDEILPPINMVRVEPVKPGAAPFIPAPYMPPGTKLIPLSTGKLITPASRDIWHYEFDLSAPGLSTESDKIKYGLGTCLAIHPRNNKEEVDKFIDFYRLNGDEEVTIASAARDSKRTALPEKTNVRQLFTEVLDVFGKPNKRFYEYLRLFADGSEREHLELFSKKEGKQEYRDNREETVTFFDLLKQYPSAHPPLEYLVEMIPVIKPRYYSIASANKMFHDKLHLSVMTVDWSTPTGRKRHGLTTNYLKDQFVNKDTNPGAVCAVKPAVVNFPPDDITPQVMVGVGTGIAPFRAMIQYRVQLRNEGKPTGPMSFFMGVQSKKVDYLYGDEFEDYQAKGILTEHNPAFSRDQKQKIYVQDKLAENRNLYDLLVKQKGYFYLCGPSRRVPDQVKQGIFNSWKSTHNLTDEQCVAEELKMKEEGRWNEETWS